VHGVVPTRATVEKRDVRPVPTPRFMSPPTAYSTTQVSQQRVPLCTQVDDSLSRRIPVRRVTTIGGCAAQRGGVWSLCTPASMNRSHGRFDNGNGGTNGYLLPLVSYEVSMTGIAKSDERIRVRRKATKSDSDSPRATTAHNLGPLVLFTCS
jgi:hypothetical protein